MLAYMHPHHRPYRIYKYKKIFLEYAQH